MADDEVWKPIPGHPNYHASTLGRIKNVRSGHVLAGFVDKRGYHKYSVRAEHRRVTAYGHRLVAAAFFGFPPPGHIVNHLDGLKNNNHVDNLEYTTPVGNARHAAALGLLRPGRLPGEQNPQAKLTDDRVVAMRRAYRDGTTPTALSREHGVTPRAVHLIVSRRAWRHVADG